MHDLGLIGAGLSAHFFAQSHLKRFPQHRVLLIDPLLTPPSHSLCYWGPKRFPKSVKEFTWPKWIVSFEKETLLFNTPETPYSMVLKDDLLKAVRQSLESTNQVFFQNDKIEEVHQDKSHFLLRGQENTFRCRQYLDSRIRFKTPLIQNFYGETIELKEGSFEADTAILMDFQNAKDCVHFFYFLPLSKTKGLLTSTLFTGTAKDRAWHERKLKLYADTKWNVDWSRPPSHRESGTLPMGQVVGNAHQIGTSNQMMRPSTGYALEGILKAADLYKQKGKITSPFSKTFTFMDALMTKYMLEHPEAIPKTMIRLFKNTPPQALVKFLQGEGGIPSCFRVAFSLLTDPAAIFFIKKLLTKPVKRS